MNFLFNRKRLVVRRGLPRPFVLLRYAGDAVNNRGRLPRTPSVSSPQFSDGVFGRALNSGAVSVSTGTVTTPALALAMWYWFGSGLALSDLDHQFRSGITNIYSLRTQRYSYSVDFRRGNTVLATVPAVPPETWWPLAFSVDAGYYKVWSGGVLVASGKDATWSGPKTFGTVNTSAFTDQCRSGEAAFLTDPLTDAQAAWLAAGNPYPAA